jgi:GNAT superfamily N-acetyltransferase
MVGSNRPAAPRKSKATPVSAPRRPWTVRPLTPERWPDFEALFGPRGAYGGCWCMFFRLPRKDFTAGCADRGAGNRRAMRALVRGGAVPGLLAYDGEVPVGWCALAPREDYGGLARSRIAKPIDDRPVWSATCFFVARTHRRRGVTVALLNAAAKHVAAQGGRILEGYPTTGSTGAWADVTAYHGTVAAFEKAGFKEVARPSRTRAVMRRSVRARST